MSDQKREVLTPEIEQLIQIANGPVRDGDLISKCARDKLFENGYVIKTRGFNTLSGFGCELCVVLGILKP